jgi:nucleoside 2-deoxyribosyltransferase
MKIKRVYIASPLCNKKERQENEEIDAVLKKAGFDTFLPQRDGFLYVDICAMLQKKGCSFEDAQNVALNLVAHCDVYNVPICYATVLNLNGRVPDEGALVEAGISFALKKPVVLYKSDYRSLIPNHDNPLVEILSGFEIVHRMEQIPIKLRELEKSKVAAYERTIKLADKILRKNPTIEELVELGIKYFLRQ